MIPATMPTSIKAISSSDNPSKRTRRWASCLAAAVLAAVALLGCTGVIRAAQPAGDCTAPPEVCAARNAVLQVASYDPHGSAVRIGEDLLVTNRHVVADETRVTITTGSGPVSGEVIPTAYRGDLVLIRAKLPEGPVLQPGSDVTGDLVAIAYDQSRKGVTAYAPGELLLRPRTDKLYGRLYHTAFAPFGSSGGALVNAKGALVGIVTSGGHGRYEAIPASAIDRLKDLSGPQHLAESQRIGAAYRACETRIRGATRGPDRLDAKVAKELADSCRLAENRQLMDDAARILRLKGEIDLSLALYQDAIDRDPHAINSRLGYVMALHSSGRYTEEVPIIRDLVEIIPGERLLHWYAVQAGKWGGDPELVETGLALIARYSPRQLAAANEFVAADTPPPPRRAN